MVRNTLLSIVALFGIGLFSIDGAARECPEGGWSGTWESGILFSLIVSCENGKTQWEYKATLPDSKIERRGETELPIIRVPNSILFVRGSDNKMYGCDATQMGAYRGSARTGITKSELRHPPPIAPTNPEGLAGTWHGFWGDSKKYPSTLRITRTPEGISFVYSFMGQDQFAERLPTNGTMFRWKNDQFFFVLGANDKLYGCRASYSKESGVAIIFIVMERQ